MSAAPNQVNPPAGERLDSWKEISAYLKRDPRTLQRWEKNERLPVHRHVHESQVSVYAYTVELDAWLASRTRSNGNGLNGGIVETRTFRGYIWSGIGVLGVAMVLIIFAIFERVNHRGPTPARAYRQVWVADGVDSWNAVSPDGRYVSFTDVRTGDLAVHDVVSGQDRHVTNKGRTAQESHTWAWSSVFSPDAKSIAYWWTNEDRSNEVRVIGLDGRGQRTLLKDPLKTEYDLMDWSPDGNAIAVIISRAEGADLALLSPRDGSMRVLKRFASGQAQRAAFSRDGRYLAYDAPGGPNRRGDIFLISLDGKEDRPLISYPTNEFLVGWSPKGDSIIFGSDRTGSTGIWRAAFRQGRIQGDPGLLKGDVGRVIPLSVARSGVIFVLLNVGLEDIFLHDLSSPNPPARMSEQFVGTRTYPAFSPDGTRLLYESQRGPTDGSTLRVRALDSGEEQVIRPAIAWFMKPRWADGGRNIDVQGNDGKTFGTWRIDPHSGQARLIAAGPLRRVYTPPEGLSGPGDQTPAPDGSATIVTVRDSPKGYNSLRIVPRGGGPARELVRLKQPDHFTAGFAWSPDSRWVYFARSSGTATELFEVPAAGGAIESTGLRAPSILFLSIHPDGKRIAFQSGSGSLEMWALDGFLSP